MIKKLKKKIINFLQINNGHKDQEEIKILLGKINSDLNKQKKPKNINDIEFKVFSQFGDDGIIQFLINKLEIDHDYKNFIEFGVENYTESNTRFLMFNDNWSGLIIDASEKNISEIKNNYYYWRYDLEAVCSFVTTKNINNIIEKSKINKKIGLLSIDIDGNDYWIWKKIDVIDPIIVVIEYNSNFGFKEKISVSYKENFMRNKEHYSNLFWGASLGALQYLAKQKGYEFVCTNSSGNNAYFVKFSQFEKLDLNLIQKYHDAKFRESRDINGKKNFLNKKDRIKEISELEVVNVETDQKIKLNKILN